MVEAVHRELAEGSTIEGSIDPRFEAVLTAFAENFARRGEVGASVALVHDGATVVDLWGGFADAENRHPWAGDTISIVFSSTKGATALCAHMLVSRGELDLEQPVAELWPEFAANGKQNATVRMMLDHSAGVPALRVRMKKGGYTDWDYMVECLAAEEPFWAPGTRNGYHGLTFGWTVGELVRRVSGKSLGTFFADEVAGPLGLDFWIGLPEAEEPRVATMIPYRFDPKHDPMTPFMDAVLNRPDSIPALFLMNSGGFIQGGAHSRAARAAEIGAANGMTNARGLAGMYAPLAVGGEASGVRLVDRAALAAMGEVSMATHLDATLMIPTRFAPGFMKSMDNRRRAGPNQSAILGSAAFGHVGAGGSIGFADPEAGFSFGYTMNRMGDGLLLNACGQSLVDAAYRSFGYADDAGGVWAR